ncbi:MAG: peptidoglycan domain protein [Alphaproteobacteria bacterium]|nr:peptidoglycan domain protein [Alphaproteobacteria bacterium]
MSTFEPFANKILSLEGGISDHPADRGRVTNMGVTLSSWRCMGYDKDGDGDIDRDDLLRITHNDAVKVLRYFYWKRWRADEIVSQPVAEILVDWLWCSGKWGIIIPQQILGVEPDGFVGRVTIKAVNQSDPVGFHRQVYRQRLAFIHHLIERDPVQQVFLKGWIRRIEQFSI